METSQISRALDDRFLIATYLAAVERAYGRSGLRIAKELLAEIRRDGDQAVDRHCGGDPVSSSETPAAPKAVDSQNSFRSDFVTACADLEVSSVSEQADDGLPCHIRCGAEHTVCDTVCDALPGWKERLLCHLVCDFKFLVCLANC